MLWVVPKQPPKQVAALWRDIDGAPVLDNHLALRTQNFVIRANADTASENKYMGKNPALQQNP